MRGANFSDLEFPSRDEMRQVLAGQETIFPPDTEFAYSNLGASLAGEIVTELSGEPWSQYVERHILQPLGMTASLSVPVADMPGLAVGYERRAPGRPRVAEPFVDVGAEAPAGNLVSNVEDMARFVSFLILNGELTMITPDAENPWTSRLILKPVGPDTFRIAASGLRGEPSETSESCSPSRWTPRTRSLAFGPPTATGSR